ncbi:energy transducer TonB [Neolewinella lacunae]|uniref:Energy transducer TonB n=1 Tax=Neolewinella lacunae TaxID=1517758 RepID=A0A923T8D7_9BACT|nr:energy transducer TonB [Neolewinella lacunae]MBC6994464.1 energy transducer TonB [Neolewinella lacunae]MDN3634157.1 energy transducer TonB [Neolewinella lacunae]
MKFFLSLICCLPLALFAQTDTAALALGDTTIYDIVDEVARFPTPCERLDTTAAAKAECSQASLLDYVNRRVLYPAEARDQNISGMAVIGFVVEKTGLISSARIMRDPGGQLGLAALRSVIGMANEVRFRPAYKNGQPVRFNFVLPIRFRLEEPKPYVLVEGDTIYTEPTTPLAFIGQDGDLAAYFTENIKYPASGEDSCRIGQLDIQLLVRPNGSVDVLDVTDYNDLGTDFTFEAINVATKSYGKWRPAEYNGRKVTAAYEVSFTFAPENPGCQQIIDYYNDAVTLINEGQALAQDSTTLAEGLLKMDQAVSYFPRDGRFRIVRGQTRMDNNLLAGACEDLQLARSISLIDWYDSVLPLICRKAEE